MANRVDGHPRHPASSVALVHRPVLVSLIVATIALLTPAIAFGQALRGVAFDSLITRRPLAGAEIWSPTLGRTVTTDATGQFSFDQANAAGRDTIELSVYHPVLERMAVPGPHIKVPAAAIGGDAIAVGVPSAETLRRLTCRTAADSEGVLVIGRISGASASAGPLRLGAFWEELAATRTTLERRPRSATAEIRGTTFWLCSAPVATPFALIAQKGNGPATVVRVGATQELFVVRHINVAGATDSTRARGTERWTLTGRVVSRLGDPVANAEVSVNDGRDGRVRSNADGTFALGLAGGGRREIGVRAVGYEPTVLSIYFAARSAALPELVLERTVQLLAERAVKASASGLSGFDYRRRSGMGHYIDREQIEKRRALTASQLFMGVPGVLVQQSGTITFSRAENPLSGCLPLYFIDGVAREIMVPSFTPLLPPDLGPGQFVRPEEIEAIEVYKGLGSIPAEFKKLNAGCGVIVIWTRRGLDAREQAPPARP